MSVRVSTNMVRTVLVLLSLSLSLALIGVSASAPTPPSPTVTTFPSLIDHFSTSTQTFQQKILTCTTYWSNTTAGAPVLFYTGNEGPIESFYSNTGSIFSWAQELGALIIFVEHRYYGSSLPYGNESFTRENIRFLTIEQALEDYAVIISSLQVSYGLTGANAVPWIAVGGSYGGVLAAWIRYKYPSLIQGAIAASAPIKYLSPKVDYTYFAAATSDYAGVSQECVDVVRKGYQQLVDLIEDENYVRIQNTWQLCDMPTAETVEHLILWSVNSLLSLAQYDYPYPTNFEAPLGAYPVTQACSILTSTEEPLEFIRLGAAAGLFYNGTGGSLTCFDTKTEFVECADQTGCGLGSDGTAWDYQVCTEFVYLPGTNGKTDMFPVRDFDLQALTYYCQETYGVTPNPTILNTNFGGDDIINIASNIVFSNGALDPYHMGGFTPSEKASSSSLKSGVLSETLGNSITLLLIQDAAHHLDLRFANTLDPESVVEARQIELKNIKLWISQFVPPTTTDDSADSSSSSSSNTDAAGVDDSSSSSSSPSSSILLDNSWSHVSRVSSDSKVSLKLALKHGDAEGLQRKFETTFNPKLSETYLQYPSESELRELVQPKEEVQQLMSNWIVESGLCASENDSSCKVTWSSYKDMVTITTSASRMETFLQDEIHLYTHTRKSGRLAIRSSLSSITHLLPETLVRHVSYTSGVTSWPWLMKAHSNVASTTKVLEIKPNMNLVKVENHEEVRQTYINKLNTNVNAFKKAVASSSNDGNMVGTLPNSALELLHVANFRSGDGNIDLSMMLVYCQLTPTIVLVDYAFDGTIYCTASDGTRIYYQGLRIDVVGVDGSSSPSMTLNSVGLVNTEQGELIVATGTIDVASNYVGYEIRLTPIFSNGNGQTSLYPFPISSMQTVKPSFLRSMVNLPGNLVTQRGSKLGIGALGVTGGTGFYSASDLEQFWSENSLPSSPYTSWVDFSPFKQTNDPTQPDVETQLDIQFGMGLFGSPYGSGTIYHASSSTDNEFDLIIDGVLSDPTPPVTLSFSYGGNEAQSNQGGAAGTIDHTNGRFQALALKGISVFVSSGDSGAYMVQADYATTCGAFSPSYPGSSPVRGTQGTLAKGRGGGRDSNNIYLFVHRSRLDSSLFFAFSLFSLSLSSLVRYLCRCLSIEVQRCWYLSDLRSKFTRIWFGHHRWWWIFNTSNTTGLST